MEATGEFVGLIRELSARVQARKNQLDATHLLFRVNVHGHAPAIIRDLQRSILEERYVDLLAVPPQSLVDAVVDAFRGRVIGTGGVRIHARTAPYGLESTQYFNVGSCV